MELISVIVPVYNVERYLNKCIESIVNQTYKNLEIILVDDGSLDSSGKICDQWKKKDTRIKVIHKKNGGLSDARNEGMRIGTGEFVGFIDSDDWIAPEMYERLYKAIIIDNSDISACSVQMVWEDNSQSRMLTQQSDCILNKSEAQLALLDESILKQPVWYKLYRRGIIENVLFEKGKYHEDVFWSFQVVGNARRVSIINYIGYYYLQRSASIMGEKYSLKRLDIIEGKCNRQDYLKNHFPELESKGLIDLWFTCLYHGQATLRELTQKEKLQALETLNVVINKYPITKDDIKDLKKVQRIWILLAKISFVKACKIRNLLRIGV